MTHPLIWPPRGDPRPVTPASRSRPICQFEDRNRWDRHLAGSGVTQSRAAESPVSWRTTLTRSLASAAFDIRSTTHPNRWRKESLLMPRVGDVTSDHSRTRVRSFDCGGHLLDNCRSTVGDSNTRGDAGHGSMSSARSVDCVDSRETAPSVVTRAMRTARIATTVAIPLLLLVACNGGDDTSLTVEADVTLCMNESRCVSLPANGARVVVRSDSGREYVKSLPRDGSTTLAVQPGTYSGRIEYADLGVSTRFTSSPQVSVSENGQGELALQISVNADKKS